MYSKQSGDIGVAPFLLGVNFGVFFSYVVYSFVSDAASMTIVPPTDYNTHELWPYVLGAVDYPNVLQIG